MKYKKIKEILNSSKCRTCKGTGNNWIGKQKCSGCFGNGISWFYHDSKDRTLLTVDCIIELILKELKNDIQKD